MLWVDWHPLGHHCNTDEEIIVYIWIEDRKFSDSDSLRHWQIARNTLIFSGAFSSCFFLLLSLSLSPYHAQMFLWLLVLLSGCASLMSFPFPCFLLTQFASSWTFLVACSLFFFSGSHCKCCFLHAMAACTFSPWAPSPPSPKSPASHPPADAMCCLGVSVTARSPGPSTQLRGHICCSHVNQPPCCHPTGPKPSQYPQSLTLLHHTCSW